jgi:hypothetical protein
MMYTIHPWVLYLHVHFFFMSKYLHQSCGPKPMTRVDINDNNQSTNKFMDENGACQISLQNQSKQIPRKKKLEVRGFRFSYMDISNDEGVWVYDGSCLSLEIDVSSCQKVLLVEVEFMGNYGVVRRASPPLQSMNKVEVYHTTLEVVDVVLLEAYKKGGESHF